ncbi:MAG: dTDP-4-dehydrorhamnose reductase, partial [Desulfobacterales bacterium]
MTILLVGSSGQLGREVIEKGKFLFGSEMVAMDLPEIDITEYSKLSDIFYELRPSIVINTAAYTAVDAAETQKDLCYAVNRDGPANLARLCRKSRAALIHISTDYVFNGNIKRPYNEDDPVCPLGIYGTSKAEGEKAVLAESDDCVIIRTSWLYSRHGKNFVKTMLRIAMQKDTIKVVSDQYGCPTCAADLADAVLVIAKALIKKTPQKHCLYHYCGKGITTWYDFAVSIFDIAGRVGLSKIPTVVPISTAQFPTAAKRPVFSALDCSSIEED